MTDGARILGDARVASIVAIRGRAQVADLSVAAKILDDAKKLAAEGERQNNHGDTTDSFTAIAEMWSVYIRHSVRVRHKGVIALDGIDVAQMMSLLKKMRSMFGAPIREHSVDDAGYTSIAGMMTMAHPTATSHYSVEAAMRQAVEENHGASKPTTSSKLP